MSSPKRPQWLSFLFSLALLLGMSAPTSAADNDVPEMSVVEQAFWICLQDHTATITSSAAQCCDGAACYTCLSDFSECWISNDTSSSYQKKAELQSPRPIIGPMQERPSKGQLQGVCESVKANFVNVAGFGYTCSKPDCDKKGNDCSIVCHNDRSCTALTPDAIRHAVSLLGILQNGDNIDRSNSSSPSENMGGGGGGNKDGSGPCGPDGCLY